MLKNSLFLILIILFFSCKKDKDTVLPTISVSLPLENSTYNATDTITIKAVFEDDKQLEYVKVMLKNDQNNVVAPSQTFYPADKKYTLQTTFVLGDEHTLTGKYTFDFIAFDGTNIKHEFVSIYINEVPKILKGIYLIDDQGGNTQINDFNNGNPQSITIKSGAYIKAFPDNYFQQLIIAYNQSQIEALEASTYTTRWTNNENCSVNLPCITATTFSDNQFFYATYYQKIKGLNENGSGVFNVQLSNSNEFAELIFADDAYVLAEITNYTASTTLLNIYYRTSSALYQQYNFNAVLSDIIAITPYGVNEYLILGNDLSGNAKLLVYNRLSNSYWEPKTLPQSPATLFTKINDNEYLMVIGNTTYKYVKSNNSLFTYLNNTYTGLVYEPLNNQLFTISNNQVDVYNYSTIQLQYNYTHSNNVLDIIPFYNK